MTMAGWDIEERFLGCLSRAHTPRETQNARDSARNDDRERREGDQPTSKSKGARLKSEAAATEATAQAGNTLLGMTAATGPKAISREAAKGVQCPQFPKLKFLP
jgi:hypothetical protein